MVGSGTPAVTAATPKLCRRPRGHACGPSMPAVRMDRAHLPVRGLPGDGPQGASRAPRARLEASQAMHELKGVHQVLGHRNRPPVLCAALQGRDPKLSRLEVGVTRADPEHLGHPAPGRRERPGEGLHRGLRVRPGRGEEALALGGGEIFPAARVDQGERTVGQGPEKLHYFINTDQRRDHPPLSATRQRAIPARPWPWGVRKRDTMNMRSSA